jgi:HAD superfamily hydrolase (TIGR01509 family)
LMSLERPSADREGLDLPGSELGMNGKTNNSGAPLKAVIFDMDGLMLDTESIGLRAWTRACASFGFDLPREAFLRMCGLNHNDSRLILLETFGSAFPYEEVKAERLKVGLEIETNEGIELKPGLLEVLSLLDEFKIPKAVATSTEQARTERRLKQIGLFSRFNAFVTGDEVTHSKPDPEIFLRSAARLGADPESCLVLEDSEAGVRAADRAGMRVIVVPDLREPTADVCALAFARCQSLLEAIDRIRELL